MLSKATRIIDALKKDTDAFAGEFINSFNFACDLFKKIVFRKHFALFSVAMISKKIQNDHIGLQLI